MCLHGVAIGNVEKRLRGQCLLQLLYTLCYDENIALPESAALQVFQVVRTVRTSLSYRRQSPASLFAHATRFCAPKPVVTQHNAESVAVLCYVLKGSSGKKRMKGRSRLQSRLRNSRAERPVSFTVSSRFDIAFQIVGPTKDPSTPYPDATA